MKVQLVTSEQFNRCKPVAFIGHVIPEKPSLFHDKGPQGQIEGSGPMKQLVRHHRPTQVVYGLDAAFDDCILMMSTNTTESLWPILNATAKIDQMSGFFLHHFKVTTTWSVCQLQWVQPAPKEDPNVTSSAKEDQLLLCSLSS